MIALTVTSLLRSRMGYRTWRAVHWTAYACWPVALLHGLGTGTDTQVSWVLLLTLVCVAAVAALVAWRLAVGWPAHAAFRVAGAVAVLHRRWPRAAPGWRPGRCGPAGPTAPAPPSSVLHHAAGRWRPGCGGRRGARRAPGARQAPGARLRPPGPRPGCCPRPAQLILDQHLDLHGPPPFADTGYGTGGPARSTAR